MKPMKNKSLKEKRQGDVYEQFARPVRNRLMDYREKRELSTIAGRLGFHVARLSEMITLNGDGKYKRKITPYYLAKFIENDVISVPEILHGKKLDDLPERPRMFFERMMIPRKTLQGVIEARTRGIDVDRLLEETLEREGR